MKFDELIKDEKIVVNLDTEEKFKIFMKCANNKGLDIDGCKNGFIQYYEELCVRILGKEVYYSDINWYKAKVYDKDYNIIKFEDIDEFKKKKKLPQIDLSNRYISIVDDENRDLLFDMLEEQGFVWCEGREKPREWYQWKTVTRIHTTDKEIYCSGTLLLHENISNILKENEKVNPSNFGKIMEKVVGSKQFTKSDLKNGMVVENRKGNRYLFISNNCLSEDGYLELNCYNEDLKRINGVSDITKINIYDIVKVYKLIKTYSLYRLVDCLSVCNLELIWERKEVKIPRKWSDWQDYAVDGDYHYHYMFRENGKRVEVKAKGGKFKASSSCHYSDVFNVDKGKKFALARLRKKMADYDLKKIEKEM